MVINYLSRTQFYTMDVDEKTQAPKVIIFCYDKQFSN
jgi:hypothetical protein